MVTTTPLKLPGNWMPNRDPACLNCLTHTNTISLSDRLASSQRCDFQDSALLTAQGVWKPGSMLGMDSLPPR